MKLPLIALLFISPTFILFNHANANGIVNIDKEYQTFYQYFSYNPNILKLALQAYDCGILQNHQLPSGKLAIIDYELPSSEKRFWVLDLNHNKLLYNTYVAHGAGSGKESATHFSNDLRSDRSSIGLYETGNNYFGTWGYAMRLYGLEPGFNNNAFKRNIVLHGGGYVSQNTIEKYGMIGMSHGCFVVPEKLDHPIINSLKKGSLIFAYYPNSSWLNQSKFLHCSVNKKII